VLAVRLDAVGDVLMTTPALRALKAQRADRRLTLVTSTAGAAIARLVPEVDDVVTYDAPWMKATAARDADADRALLERLRAGGFDAAAIFTVYSQSPLPAALACHLAGIPLRLAHCRENPYHLLTDWVPEPEPAQGVRHEVERQLALVATVGASTPAPGLSLRVPAAAARSAEARLVALGLDGTRPWVALHPGASAPSRRYPPEAFARVARLLHDDGLEICFVGAAAEQGLVDGIRAAMGRPSRSLAGETSLAELAAVLARAPLLVANNSGPVHLAAAVGTPVVDLYALTNPQHTPWRVPHRVLSADVPCRWCYKSVCPEGHHACLRGVAPERVRDAVRELLAAEGRDERGRRPAPGRVA
jgi:lipopolysaccharide heptosyltransferase II